MKGGALGFVFLLGLVVAFLTSQDHAQSQSPSLSAFQMRQIAYVKASNADAGDHFGCGGSLSGHTGNAVSFSHDGSTLVVGAPHESSGAKGANGNQDDESVYNSGAVYVFVRESGNWRQQAYLKASNPGASDRFGSVVSLSGDGNTLAVSAPFESSAAKGVGGDQSDDSIPQAGAVYVFTRSGATWSQQSYIKASNTGRPADPNNADDWGDGDQFGYSLDLSADGNTLAVSAITEDSRAAGVNTLKFQDDDSAAQSGAVYVFTRAGSAWTQQAYIKAANSEAGDLFGYNVGLSADGNVLAASGYDEDGSGRQINAIPDNRANGSGCLYVFERAGGVWRQTAYLKGSRTEAVDALGYSLAISDDGNTIAGGAADETCLTPGVNPPGCIGGEERNSSPGAAYVFVRAGNTWTEQAFIKASNPTMLDVFGLRLALSGDGNTLAVSATSEDSASQGINGKQNDESANESGAVYFYTRSGTTWTQQAYVKGANTEAFDEFGASLTLTYDGKLLAVGAPKEDSSAKGVGGDQRDNSVQESGAMYIFSVN